jgi:hypothetical protein
MIDPGVEFESPIETGTAYFSDGFLTIVLDTGEDHQAIQIDDPDLDTDELDAVLGEEAMTRTGDWYLTEDGEHAAPVLVGVRPDEPW